MIRNCNNCVQRTDVSYCGDEKCLADRYYKWAPDQHVSPGACEVCKWKSTNCAACNDGSHFERIPGKLTEQEMMNPILPIVDTEDPQCKACIKTECKARGRVMTGTCASRTEPDPACKDCHWWKKTQHKTGECREKSPIAIPVDTTHRNVQHITAWPWTKDSDSCGQFKRGAG